MYQVVSSFESHKQGDLRMKEPEKGKSQIMARMTLRAATTSV
jgi:hypothetical protein